MPRLDADLVSRLYERAHAARWSVPASRFASALEASADRAFSDKAAGARDVERYLAGLHLEDLALACACADGNGAAWDHFVLQHRPVLYRSADALDPGGAAREIADALYAELFGVRERDGERQSLFRYFHGRSSLATWLRAVLSQRFVDRIRSHRRLEPLPEEDDGRVMGVAPAADPDRARLIGLLRLAIAAAIARLDNRDRLRLALYYGQQLTLAQAGRVLKEHEATVSRQLARTRAAIKRDVEDHLRTSGRLSDPEIAQCLESAMDDAGPLDLGVLFGTAESCKKGGTDRSI
jgi:RNA polymerase sigma-70 factor (ECF subfamily)